MVDPALLRNQDTLPQNGGPLRIRVEVWLQCDDVLTPNPNGGALSSWQNSIRLLIVSSFLMICFAISPAKPRKMKHIATGNWGGSHININVGTKSVTIEYDCANGVITAPFVVDIKGRFNLRGTHTTEHGGPVRDDRPQNSRPALYTGWVKGQSMSLTVKLVGSNEPLGTFELVHGKSGRVFKCL